MDTHSYGYIYNKTLSLPTFQKKELVKELLLSILSEDHENIDYEHIAQIACPHCNSTNKVKNGRLKNRQRYLCKGCDKSYNTFTKTPISYSKKDISQWEQYIKMLLSCESLRKTANALNISLSTAFYWRHKLLDALRENAPDNPTLKNSIKIFEHYTRESFKGSNILSSRKPYKSGEKPGYKFISNNDVCILIASDNINPPIIEMSCLDKPKDETLDAIFNNTLEKGSAIITDKWIPYKRLAEKNNLIYVPHLNKYNPARKYHIRNIKNISENLNGFLSSFQGVATKYLENYLCLFKKIHYINCKLDFNLHTHKNIRISDYKFREPQYK